MSEPMQVTTDPLVPGVMFYSLLKPAPILNRDGTPNYLPFLQTLNIAEALQALSHTPGAVMMFNACVAKAASAPLPPSPKPQ